MIRSVKMVCALALIGALSLLVGSLEARVVTVLHSFPTNGVYPSVPLVQGADGSFYGTTEVGGSHEQGTVFKVTPEGTETVIYNFGARPSDGIQPNGIVLGRDGNFYGTTGDGGSRNNGTVFKIAPSGKETILHDFGSHSSDGSIPLAGLVQGRDGDFYGTTFRGGAHDRGAVFKITPSGAEIVLHSFGAKSNDGINPQAALVSGSDGNFYGTTYRGGSQGKGTIFKITPSGRETVIYSFGTNPNDGANPQTALVYGTDGNFYGVTQSGISEGYGTVFKISPSGAETVLYGFGTNPDDGNGGGYDFAGISALVQGRDDNFYGTTGFGGGHSHGTVFMITPSGTETVLYSFGTNLNDGNQPSAALVQGSDGNFYGTTYYGGPQGPEGNGTIFKITPAGAETVIYDFGTDSNDGTFPRAALVQGGDGNFYGTTYEGGNVGKGTVFEITPAGTEALIYSFGADPNDGANPNVLVLGSDGNLYGTTISGGSHTDNQGDRCGTIFEIAPSGAETVLYNFGTNPDDGSSPSGPNGLIQGSDGNLYGTTSGGGFFGAGTIFKITPSGRETVLYAFGAQGIFLNRSIANSNAGSAPSGPNGLVQGSDGNFYGTTHRGGDQGLGTVFKFTSSGMETIYNFGTNRNDGANPQAGLVQGSDGDFYGTTEYGGLIKLPGSTGIGTVFKVTPSGVETVLYRFGAKPDDGVYPNWLVQGSDGDFYGTTYYGGGSKYNGAIFKVRPSGKETILDDFRFLNGAYPVAPLVRGSDGCLYGSTVQGGIDGGGIIFKLTP